MGAITWTEFQIQFLKDNYFKLGCTECSQKLNKTYGSVRAKAIVLKIGSDKSKNKTRKKEIINQRFGKLVAVKQLKEKERGSYIYSFKCDCGKTKAYSVTSVLRAKNPVSSCGECVSRSGTDSKNWKGEKFISKSFFGSIKASAFKRLIEFDLTIEYLDELWISQNKICALSGTELFLNYKPSKSKENLPHTASLDRIDSTKHYCKDNVRWVHKDLNRMKWNISDKDFIKYCGLVIEHNKKPSIEDRTVNDVDNMDFGFLE
jgi:hypothetical protein